MMKQTKLFMLSLLILSMATQCNIASARENLKNCKFSLEDINIKGMSLSGLDLGLMVGVQNTNSAQVIVDRMDVDIFLDSKNIGKANTNKRVEINSGQKKIIKFLLKTSYSQMGTALISNLKGSGEIPYKLVGTAHLKFPLIGEIALPFVVEDVLKR